MAATSSADANAAHDDAWSLTRGGPLFELERRLRLLPRGEQTLGVRFPLVAMAVAWLPVVLFALPDRLVNGHWDPLVARTELHVRMLGSLFLFLLSEGVFEERAKVVTRRIFEADLLTHPNVTIMQASILRLVRLRDARVPELSLLGAVYAVSLIAYLGQLPPGVLRWMAPTIHQAGLYWNRATPAEWWYLLVSQPLFLFVFTRWLFRWGLWSRLVWCLAKLSPRVDPGHADRAGGLGFLAAPLFGLRFFVGGAALALSSVWLDEIARSKAEPAIFANDLVLFVSLSVLLALLPYLRLTRVLVEAKHKGLLAYSLLMRRYTERFEQRWLHPSERDQEMLGSNDFQAMADMGTSYSVVNDMRALVPTLDELKAHLAVTVLPFLAIPVLHSKSTAELIQRIVLKLIGGG